MASQSPRPLKGGATLEGVDYFDLLEESGTEEDKWLLRETETKWQHWLSGFGDKRVQSIGMCLDCDTMGGEELKVRV